MSCARFADRPHGLPPHGFGRDGDRWTASLKAAVVTAVEAGHLSLQDAACAYGLSADEMLSWRRAHMLAGPSGLRAVKGLAATRPSTRLRSSRVQPNAREIIPTAPHKGVSLPRLRFMQGGRDA